MKLMIDRFYAFLDRPIRNRARIVLAALLLPLFLSYLFPLWNIRMVAPQYPKGLELDIYSYKLEGGHEGRDIQEINTLNHYIGMRPITREDMKDLDWMPFAIGILGLLALRAAAIGTIRSLVDMSVLAVYVSGFAFARFWYMMYAYGHELDPAAPFKVEPFTPVILGTKQVANFETSSYPAAGSIFMGAFVLGLLGVTAWQLIAGRRAAVRQAADPSGPPSQRADAVA